SLLDAARVAALIVSAHPAPPPWWREQAEGAPRGRVRRMLKHAATAPHCRERVREAPRVIASEIAGGRLDHRVHTAPAGAWRMYNDGHVPSVPPSVALVWAHHARVDAEHVRVARRHASRAEAT